VYFFDGSVAEGQRDNCFGFCREFGIQSDLILHLLFSSRVCLNLLCFAKLISPCLASPIVAHLDSNSGNHRSASQAGLHACWLGSHGLSRCHANRRLAPYHRVSASASMGLPHFAQAYSMHSSWIIVPSRKIRNSVFSWNSLLQTAHFKLSESLIPHSDKKFTSCVLNEDSDHSGFER
jgi:hypothetical protein